MVPTKKINTKKYLIVFPFKKNILFVTKISLKKFREIENILYDFPVIFCQDRKYSEKTWLLVQKFKFDKFSSKSIISRKIGLMCN